MKVTDRGFVLVRSAAKPLPRLGVVLLHPEAIGVHAPEIVLGEDIALVRSAAVPFHRLRVILRYALALGIHNPEVVLAEVARELAYRLYVVAIAV